MNFNFMPELDYAPAYFIVWGIMLATALGMLIFFKRRKWI
jgi:magnesium transporter